MESAVANLTYFNLGYTDTATAYGQITQASPTNITVQFASISVVDTYIGQFTYGADGSLTGGVLTEVDSSYHGAPTFQMTNLAIPASQFANAVLNGDTTTLVNLLLAGDDQIYGSTSGEFIYGGPGNDSVIALDGNDTVLGGAGNDDVNGNVGDDSVSGGDGNDIVRGGKGNDTVYGDAGDDPHVNGNMGDDIVHGGDGNDTVYGGQGNDTVYGDAGDDLLSGDLGADVLYGGPGADRFAIAKGGGFDWVGDFNAADGDHIQLRAGTTYTVVNYQGQVVIDLGGGDELGLTGVPFASFSKDWILFA